MVDIHREYLPKHEEGFVQEILMYKGGAYVLEIENLKEKESVAVCRKVGEETKNGDYFIKIKNSNRCQLIRKDSVICLDCLNLTNEDRDSLGKISEWEVTEKNKWKLKTDEKASQ